jgi:ABC-type multidrug transport system ATPase subunit
VKIGIPGKIKGISGGQKRRLSFASEVFILNLNITKIKQ